MILKFFLYDWGGLNGALFQIINQSTPAIFMPLAWVFSTLLGNYWSAPLVMLGLWAWSRSAEENNRVLAIRLQLVHFVIAFGLALVLATALKLLFDFPRPSAVYGDLAQVIGTAEWHYSLPSGHSTYAALVVGALWPLVGIRLRLTLALYVVLVGWSRIAAGMHFPADVLAGWTIGFGCMALANRLLAALPTMVRAITPFAVPLWYGLAGTILLVDQSTKFAVAYSFAYGEQIRVTSLFNLVHVRNSGAAFSLLADAGGWQRYFFIVLALGASVWLIRILRQGLPIFEAAGFSLILGGALGNVVDRILRGAVVDFLDFYWRDMHWPAFNLADLAISLGAICLITAVMNRTNHVKSR